MSSAADPVDVACLCAAWCRLCDAYVEVLAQVAADPALAGLSLRWHWIDIEDEAELVGDLDIETFPTLVIARDGRPWFAGTLTPHAETLRRLLVSVLVDAPPDAARPSVDPAFDSIAGHLPQRAPGLPAGPGRAPA